MKLYSPLFMRLAAAGALSLGALVAGTHITAEQEGEVFYPYYDSGKVLTVCRGHTGSDIEMRNYTQAECDALYVKDLKKAQDAVERFVNPKIKPLPTSLEASLIDFVFHKGPSAFANSTLLRELNSGNTEKACDQLLRWVYIGKMNCNLPENKCGGLPKRAKLERDWCVGKYKIDGDKIVFSPEEEVKK